MPRVLLAKTKTIPTSQDGATRRRFKHCCMFKQDIKSVTDSEHGRDAERVPSDLLLEFRVPGSRKRCSGQVQDLSSTGVQFITYQNLALGTEIQLRILFVNKDTPTLMTQAEVVRRRVVAGGQGYVVACAFG